MTDLGDNMTVDAEPVVTKRPMPATKVAAKPKEATAAKPVGMPTTIRVRIEENPAIPPSGLFVGLNGRGYLIRPGEEVNLPVGVVEVLKNAVESAPVLKAGTNQIIGFRPRMRYPFTVVT